MQRVRRALIHGGLFLATLASMVLVNGFDPATGSLGVILGLQFAAPALAILAAHELGHYFAARVHRVDATLPYFIPFPLGFGTLGAVIRMKGRFPSRNALFDIGVAGPLAGMAVALPMLVIGISHSQIVASPGTHFPPGLSLWHLASELGQQLRAWVDGSPAINPSGAETQLLFGDNLLSLAATRILRGPLPPKTELLASPLFMAAWFGMLVTALNLIPAGQLDGGHTIRAYFGGKIAEALGRHTASLLLVLALIASATWLLWFAIVVRFIGFGHPVPEEDETPLSRGRKAIAWASWILTLLVFIPVPTDVIG